MADDGREIAATVLEGAGEFAARIASASSDPIVGVAVAAGSTLTGLIASLVRSLGTDAAKKTLEELKRRVDAGEGLITDADLAADDQYVDQYIAELFADDETGLLPTAEELDALYHSALRSGLVTKEELRESFDRLMKRAVVDCPMCGALGFVGKQCGQCPNAYPLPRANGTTP